MFTYLKRIFLFFTVTLVVCVQSGHTGQINNEKQDNLNPYKEIDDILNANTSPGEPEKNMIAAMSLLKSGKQLDPSVVEALKRLVMLPYLAYKCDARSSYSIYYIQQATNGSGNKIPEMVDHFSKKHKQQCRLVYLEMYTKMYEDEALDGPLVSRVETLIDDYILPDVKKAQKIGTKTADRGGNPDFVLKNNIISSTDDQMNKMIRLEAISEGIKLIARKDRFNRERVDMKLMFEKYAIKPCEYYVKYFGPKLFDSARFSVELQENMTPKSEEDFLFGWTRYRICSYLSSNADSIVKQF